MQTHAAPQRVDSFPETEPRYRVDVLAWAEENRRGQHGEHRYSAEEYGLSEALIEERFADYIAWQSKIRDAV